MNLLSPAFQPSTLAIIWLCVISLWMFLLIRLASKSAWKPLKLTRYGKGATFWLGLVLLLCAPFKQLSPSLSIRVTVLAPCFFFRMALLCLSPYLQTDLELFFYLLVCLAIFQVTVSELGQPLQLQGLYSRSPHPSFGPLEERCLQTIYLNSSWPQNLHCQINGGLVWQVHFFFNVANCLSSTASILAACLPLLVGNLWFL